jgi:LysM repeat protein
VRGELYASLLAKQTGMVLGAALLISLLFARQVNAHLLFQDGEPAVHTVQAGETLSEIAKAYGVETTDVMALNGLSDPNQIYAGQELLLPEGAIQIGAPLIDIPTHTVQAGETLSEIAKAYGVSPARLMHLNGISDANAIYSGQVLRLPAEVLEVEATAEPESATEEPATPDDQPPTAAATMTPGERPAEHVVAANETLSEIAKQYEVALDDLMLLNGIANPDNIYVGQTLRLPGAATPTPTATLESTATATPDPQSTPEEEPGTEVAEPAVAATAPPTRVSSGNPVASLNQSYTVRRDDTIARIARRLGVDAEALRRLNRLEENARLSIGMSLLIPATAEELRIVQPQQPDAAGESYVVQPGDSLSVIAKTHGLSLAALMAANFIGNPHTIYVGQRLTIPDAADEETQGPEAQPSKVGPERSGYYYYTVQPGDTLSALAKQFNSTMLALLEYNSLPNAETVYRGLELRIPFGPPPLPVDLPPTPGSGTSFLVSLSRQECWVFQGKEVLHAWKCSTGYGEWVTRTGNFAVQSKIENAKSGAYQLDMPYWLGIYNVGAYENGIHGLPVSWETNEKIWTRLIGQPATYGCAMLDDEHAAELFRLAYVGMPVYIID